MSSVVISGDTSGAITLQAPAVSGNTTLNLPTVSGGTLVTSDSSGNVGIGTSSPSTRLTVGRVDSSNEGGQIDLCRSTDNASAWAVDVFGNTSTPSLRFVDNVAAAARMVVDGSGNVGIGTSSPRDVSGYTTLAVNDTTGAIVDYMASGTRIASVGADSGALDIRAISSMPTIFSTNNTERMRIDSSGNVLVGTTTSPAGATPTLIGGLFNPNTNFGISLRPSVNVGAVMIAFYNSSGTSVGSIQSTASATSYNTSSDYRLKENVTPMTGALDTVAKLNPVTYTWKVDGSDGQGFIAHELQAVVPDCVTGEKDAVDAEGNPVYQGVDTSFLVATLTKAIQELKAIVDEQAEKIKALEAK